MKICLNCDKHVDNSEWYGLSHPVVPVTGASITATVQEALNEVFQKRLKTEVTGGLCERCFRLLSVAISMRRTSSNSLEEFISVSLNTSVKNLDAPLLFDQLNTEINTKLNLREGVEWYSVIADVPSNNIVCYGSSQAIEYLNTIQDQINQFFTFCSDKADSDSSNEIGTSRDPDQSQRSNKFTMFRSKVTKDHESSSDTSSSESYDRNKEVKSQDKKSDGGLDAECEKFDGGFDLDAKCFTKEVSNEDFHTIKVLETKTPEEISEKNLGISERLVASEMKTKPVNDQKPDSQVMYVDETLNEKPVDETLNKKPVDEMLNKKPVDETLKKKPVDETLNKKLIDEMLNKKPVDEASNKKPVAETLNKKPIDETLNKKPGDETVNKKPSDETLRKKPADDSLDKKLIDKTLKKKPIDETLIKKPVDEASNKKPADETLNKKTVNETLNKKPVDEMLNKKPVNEPLNKKPVVETSQKKPVDETSSNRSVDETVNKKPVDETLNKKTVDETLNKKPVDETLNKKTVNEPLNKKPVDETSKMKPVDETSSKRPVDETVNKKPVDERLNKKPVDETLNKKPVDETLNKKPVDETLNKKPVDATLNKKPVDDLLNKEPTDKMLNKNPIHKALNKEPVDKILNTKTVDKINLNKLDAADQPDKILNPEHCSKTMDSVPVISAEGVNIAVSALVTEKSDKKRIDQVISRLKDNISARKTSVPNITIDQSEHSNVITTNQQESCTDNSGDVQSDGSMDLFEDYTKFKSSTPIKPTMAAHEAENIDMGDNSKHASHSDEITPVKNLQHEFTVISKQQNKETSNETKIQRTENEQTPIKPNKTIARSNLNRSFNSDIEITPEKQMETVQKSKTAVESYKKIIQEITSKKTVLLKDKSDTTGNKKTDELNVFESPALDQYIADNSSLNLSNVLTTTSRPKLGTNEDRIARIGRIMENVRARNSGKLPHTSKKKDAGVKENSELTNSSVGSSGTCNNKSVNIAEATRSLGSRDNTGLTQDRKSEKINLQTVQKKFSNTDVNKIKTKTSADTSSDVCKTNKTSADTSSDVCKTNKTSAITQSDVCKTNKTSAKTRSEGEKTLADPSEIDLSTNTQDQITCPESEQTKTHDSGHKRTHDSEHNQTHDSEHNRTHDSEHNQTHDSEHNRTRDSEHNRTHYSEHKSTHGDSEQSRTNDSEERRTHDFEDSETHTSEHKRTHDSKQMQSTKQMKKHVAEGTNNSKHDAKTNTGKSSWSLKVNIKSPPKPAKLKTKFGNIRKTIDGEFSKDLEKCDNISDGNDVSPDIVIEEMQKFFYSKTIKRKIRPYNSEVNTTKPNLSVLTRDILENLQPIVKLERLSNNQIRKFSKQQENLTNSITTFSTSSKTSEKPNKQAEQNNMNVVSEERVIQKWNTDNRPHQLCSNDSEKHKLSLAYNESETEVSFPEEDSDEDIASGLNRKSDGQFLLSPAEREGYGVFPSESNVSTQFCAEKEPNLNVPMNKSQENLLGGHLLRNAPKFVSERNESKQTEKDTNVERSNDTYIKDTENTHVVKDNDNTHVVKDNDNTHVVKDNNTHVDDQTTHVVKDNDNTHVTKDNNTHVDDQTTHVENDENLHLLKDSNTNGKNKTNTHVEKDENSQNNKKSPVVKGKNTDIETHENAHMLRDENTNVGKCKNDRITNVQSSQHTHVEIKNNKKTNLHVEKCATKDNMTINNEILPLTKKAVVLLTRTEVEPGGQVSLYEKRATGKNKDLCDKHMAINSIDTIPDDDDDLPKLVYKKRRRIDKKSKKKSTLKTKNLSVTGNISAAKTGNQSITETGNQSITATGNQSITETGNQSITATGNQSITETGNQSITETENLSITETGNQSITKTGTENQSITETGNQSITETGNQSITETGNQSITETGNQSITETGNQLINEPGTQSITKEQNQFDPSMKEKVPVSVMANNDQIVGNRSENLLKKHDDYEETLNLKHDNIDKIDNHDNDETGNPYHDIDDETANLNHDNDDQLANHDNDNGEEIANLNHDNSNEDLDEAYETEGDIQPDIPNVVEDSNNRTIVNTISPVEEIFTCSICGKTYKDEFMYHFHRFNKHKINNQSELDKESKQSKTETGQGKLLAHKKCLKFGEKDNCNEEKDENSAEDLSSSYGTGNIQMKKDVPKNHRILKSSKWLEQHHNINKPCEEISLDSESDHRVKTRRMTAKKRKRMNLRKLKNRCQTETSDTDGTFKLYSDRKRSRFSRRKKKLTKNVLPLLQNVYSIESTDQTGTTNMKGSLKIHIKKAQLPQVRDSPKTDQNPQPNVTKKTFVKSSKYSDISEEEFVPSTLIYGPKDIHTINFLSNSNSIHISPTRTYANEEIQKMKTYYGKNKSITQSKDVKGHNPSDETKVEGHHLSDETKVKGHHVSDGTNPDTKSNIQKALNDSLGQQSDASEVIKPVVTAEVICAPDTTVQKTEFHEESTNIHTNIQNDGPPTTQVSSEDPNILKYLDFVNVKTTVTNDPPSTIQENKPLNIRPAKDFGNVFDNFSHIVDDYTEGLIPSSMVDKEINKLHTPLLQSNINDSTVDKSKTLTVNKVENCQSDTILADNIQNKMTNAHSLTMCNPCNINADQLTKSSEQSRDNDIINNTALSKGNNSLPDNINNRLNDNKSTSSSTYVRKDPGTSFHDFPFKRPAPIAEKCKNMSTSDKNETSVKQKTSLIGALFSQNQPKKNVMFMDMSSKKARALAQKKKEELEAKKNAKKPNVPFLFSSMFKKRKHPTTEPVVSGVSIGSSTNKSNDHTPSKIMKLDNNDVSKTSSHSPKSGPMMKSYTANVSTMHSPRTGKQMNTVANNSQPGQPNTSVLNTADMTATHSSHPGQQTNSRHCSDPQQSTTDLYQSADIQFVQEIPPTNFFDTDSAMSDSSSKHSIIDLIDDYDMLNTHADKLLDELERSEVIIQDNVKQETGKVAGDILASRKYRSVISLHDSDNEVGSEVTPFDKPTQEMDSLILNQNKKLVVSLKKLSYNGIGHQKTPPKTLNTESDYRISDDEDLSCKPWHCILCKQRYLKKIEAIHHVINFHEISELDIKLTNYICRADEMAPRPDSKINSVIIEAQLSDSSRNITTYHQSSSTPDRTITTPQQSVAYFPETINLDCYNDNLDSDSSLSSMCAKDKYIDLENQNISGQVTNRNLHSREDNSSTIEKSKHVSGDNSSSSEGNLIYGEDNLSTTQNIETTSENSQWRCMVCSQSFLLKIDVIQHIKMKHRNVPVGNTSYTFEPLCETVETVVITDTNPALIDVDTEPSSPPCVGKLVRTKEVKEKKSKIKDTTEILIISSRSNAIKAGSFDIPLENPESTQKILSVKWHCKLCSQWYRLRKCCLQHVQKEHNIYGNWAKFYFHNSQQVTHHPSMEVSTGPHVDHKADNFCIVCGRTYSDYAEMLRHMRRCHAYVPEGHRTHCTLKKSESLKIVVACDIFMDIHVYMVGNNSAKIVDKDFLSELLSTGINRSLKYKPSDITLAKALKRILYENGMIKLNPDEIERLEDVEYNFDLFKFSFTEDYQWDRNSRQKGPTDSDNEETVDTGGQGRSMRSQSRTSASSRAIKSPGTSSTTSKSPGDSTITSRSPGSSSTTTKAQGSLSFASRSPGVSSNVASLSRCHTCNITFSNRIELDQHNLTHRVRVKFTCRLCSKKFPKIYFLLQHLEMKHEQSGKKYFQFVIENEQVVTNDYQTDNDDDDQKEDSDQSSHDDDLDSQQEQELEEDDIETSETRACYVCGKNFETRVAVFNHLKNKHMIYRRKCLNCNKIFKNRTDLQKHFASAHDVDFVTNLSEQLIQCHFCDNILENHAAFRDHLKSHNGEGYNCNLCDNKYLSGPSLRFHKRTVHWKSDGTRSCKICDKIFTNMKAFESHMINHFYDFLGPMKCNTCNVTLKNKKLYKQHIASHGVSTVCDVCGKVFDDVTSLQHHLVTHKQDQQCTICNKMFNKYNYRTHMEKVHGQNDKIACHLCGNLVNASFMKMHIQEMHQHPRQRRKWGGKRDCDICGKNFKRPGLLRQHMVVHTGEKPYKCEVCGRGFGHKTALNTHYSTHKGFKPQKCKFCEASFWLVSQCKAHMKEEHDYQKDKLKQICPHCGERFKQLSALRVHMDDFHPDKVVGPKQFPCHICKKEFSYRRSLKEHVIHCIEAHKAAKRASSLNQRNVHSNVGQNQIVETFHEIAQNPSTQTQIIGADGFVQNQMGCTAETEQQIIIQEESGGITYQTIYIQSDDPNKPVYMESDALNGEVYVQSEDTNGQIYVQSCDSSNQVYVQPCDTSNQVYVQSEGGNGQVYMQDVANQDQIIVQNGTEEGELIVALPDNCGEYNVDFLSSNTGMVNDSEIGYAEIVVQNQ